MTNSENDSRHSHSGDGADVQPVPADENGETDEKKHKRAKPLKLKGTFNDALRVLVGRKPEAEESE